MRISSASSIICAWLSSSSLLSELSDRARFDGPFSEEVLFLLTDWLSPLVGVGILAMSRVRNFFEPQKLGTKYVATAELRLLFKVGLQITWTKAQPTAAPILHSLQAHREARQHLPSSHNGITFGKKRCRYVIESPDDGFEAIGAWMADWRLLQAPLVFDQLSLPVPSRPSPPLSPAIDRPRPFQQRTQRRRHNRSLIRCQVTL